MAHFAPLLLGGLAAFALANATKKRRKKAAAKKPVESNGNSTKELGPEESKRVVSSWLHRQEALKALADLGVCDCDPGQIDGKYGPDTRRAVENFQRHVGLEPTGSWEERAERQMFLLLRSLGEAERPDSPSNGNEKSGGPFGPDELLVADPQCNYMQHIADEFFEVQRKRAVEYALEGNTMGQDAEAIHQEMVEQYMPLCASLGREGVGPGVRKWWDQNVGHVAGILSGYQHLPESLEQDAQRYGLI